MVRVNALPHRWVPAPTDRLTRVIRPEHARSSGGGRGPRVRRRDRPRGVRGRWRSPAGPHACGIGRRPVPRARHGGSWLPWPGVRGGCPHRGGRCVPRVVLVSSHWNANHRFGMSAATGRRAAWAATIVPSIMPSATTVSGCVSSIASIVSAPKSAAGPAMNRSRALRSIVRGLFASQSRNRSSAGSSGAQTCGPIRGEASLARVKETGGWAYE